jgi:hypothetical protein
LTSSTDHALPTVPGGRPDPAFRSACKPQRPA